jgi:hypothetical protein
VADAGTKCRWGETTSKIVGGVGQRRRKQQVGVGEVVSRQAGGGWAAVGDGLKFFLVR